MNANKQDAGGLPGLPAPFGWYRAWLPNGEAIDEFVPGATKPADWADRDCVALFNPKVVRAYGEQCRAASVSWDGYEAFEQFLAAEIDSAPEALRRLGDWLCNVLDDDHLATANRMVIGAMMETSAAIRALSRGVPDGK